mmetsp:Transcript_15357/g.36023  ORF Transcript_15357/g.36023 Transcript_15357/m.36023 type:complete len:229 (+) Transcript_15357:652-1338(+)
MIRSPSASKAASTPKSLARASAACNARGSLLAAAAASFRVAPKRSKTISPSSIVLFSTPAALAWARVVFSTASSSPAMASSRSCVTSLVFFPAADPLVEPSASRLSFFGAGFFSANSCRNSLTLARRSSPRGREPPLGAKLLTSARPTRWNPSQSRTNVLSAASHVGMLPITTHSRLALVSATFRRRQSATKPTSPRLFARTKLTMMTSLSEPWKASTEETITPFLAS